MKKKGKSIYYLAVLVALFFISTVLTQAQESQAPKSMDKQEKGGELYSTYENTSKKLNLMEYNLIQVNLHLAMHGYFVEYDQDKEIFHAVKFVEKDKILKKNPALLRKQLLSQCELVSSVIGYVFPEFRNRSQKDLKIIFRIALLGYGEFGVYEKGDLSFNDSLNEFLNKSNY